MSHHGLFTEFESYRIPSDSDIQEALRNGLVAVDTNVLLNLYRYTKTTVDDFFEVLTKVDDRLFVPHQVAREFWRNRQSVLGNPASAIRETRTALGKNEASTVDVLTRWSKTVALDADERVALLSRVSELYAQLTMRVERGTPSQVNAETPTSEDRVLARLETLLDGHVGAAMERADWQAAIAEGNRRALADEPPGYMDKDKLDSEHPERASGDYLVWLQLMQEAARRGSDLVLVTSDTKEDWWQKSRGKNIGPRRELIKEYAKATGGRVFFLEPADLLTHSGALEVEVSSASVEDIERVRDEVPSFNLWTLESVQLLLERLDESALVHSAVIREAAANGGRVERSRVYELDGRSDEQMLSGFTKPVSRVTAELQAAGLIPDSLWPMLRSEYDTGVKTTHFAIPAEVVGLLSTLVRHLPNGQDADLAPLRHRDPTG